MGSEAQPLIQYVRPADDHLDVRLGHVHDDHIGLALVDGHLSFIAGHLEDPSQSGQAEDADDEAFEESDDDHGHGLRPGRSLNEHAPPLSERCPKTGTRVRARTGSESCRLR